MVKRSVFDPIIKRIKSGRVTLAGICGLVGGNCTGLTWTCYIAMYRTYSGYDVAAVGCGMVFDDLNGYKIGVELVESFGFVT